MSGTGGVDGLSLARAIICSKVMSVWVLASISRASWELLWALVAGARRKTWTTMGSLALRKASTASSWVALERSFPLTWGKAGKYSKGERKGSIKTWVWNIGGSIICAVHEATWWRWWVYFGIHTRGNTQLGGEIRSLIFARNYKCFELFHNYPTQWNPNTAKKLQHLKSNFLKSSFINFVKYS